MPPLVIFKRTETSPKRQKKTECSPSHNMVPESLTNKQPNPPHKQQTPAMTNHSTADDEIAPQMKNGVGIGQRPVPNARPTRLVHGHVFFLLTKTPGTDAQRPPQMLNANHAVVGKQTTCNGWNQPNSERNRHLIATKTLLGKKERDKHRNSNVKNQNTSLSHQWLPHHEGI